MSAPAAVYRPWIKHLLCDDGQKITGGNHLWHEHGGMLGEVLRKTPSIAYGGLIWQSL